MTGKELDRSRSTALIKDRLKNLDIVTYPLFDSCVFWKILNKKWRKTDIL